MSEFRQLKASRPQVKLTHYFASKMASRGKGGIILVSSFAATMVAPLNVIYGASKVPATQSEIPESLSTGGPVVIRKATLETVVPCWIFKIKHGPLPGKVFGHHLDLKGAEFNTDVLHQLDH
jgi:hypothetical protein